LVRFCFRTIFAVVLHAGFAFSLSPSSCGNPPLQSTWRLFPFFSLPSRSQHFLPPPSTWVVPLMYSDLTCTRSGSTFKIQRSFALFLWSFCRFGGVIVFFQFFPPAPVSTVLRRASSFVLPTIPPEKSSPTHHVLTYSSCNSLLPPSTVFQSDGTTRCVLRLFPSPMTVLNCPRLSPPPPGERKFNSNASPSFFSSHPGFF